MPNTHAHDGIRLKIIKESMAWVGPAAMASSSCWLLSWILSTVVISKHNVLTGDVFFQTHSLLVGICKTK